MLHSKTALLLLSLVAFAPGALAAPAGPVVTWASDPVRADETVLLFGGGFAADAVVEAMALPDRPAKGAPAAERWQVLRPLQASERSLKVVLPRAWPRGITVCRVRSGGKISPAVTLNAPDVWWLQGDRGETASPGGWVRLFGKCLSGEALSGGVASDAAGVGERERGRRPYGILSRPIVALSGPRTVRLPAEGTCWAARVAVPASLPAGEYAVRVHNGFGGEAGWRPAGALRVARPEAWKSDILNVKDFAGDADQALRAALAKAAENGGGVVFLPRGRYQVKGELVVPPKTVLRGERMELVSLTWPDMDAPPARLVGGSAFGIEEVSLYCQNHRNVVQMEDDADGAFLRRVRIRANCFFMIEDVGKEFRGRKGPASHRECGAAIQLRGRNFSVTDCDVLASNKALQVHKAHTGIVARCTLRYGGRGYNMENPDRLIFEENLVAGAHLLAIGNDITTFWTNSASRIYYAGNRLQQMYGADREMMTLDAAGGAYFGKVAAAEGTRLALAGDPAYRTYEPKPHTNWAGAAVMILDGTGAGQYRLATKNDGRAWEVDRPWEILPDDTSILSIAPFRGRNLFIGNTFEDGGSLQLYGMALDTIVAGNKGARMDGFFAWGLNPHGWGWQPAWFCQFLENEILEGNGYGHRAAFIGAFTSNNNEEYAGPLARCAVFRRNVCHNNARLRLGGTVEDALIEHCTVRHADTGIEVRPGPRSVLLRGNTFEDVGKPLDGDGAVGVAVVE